MPIHTFVLEIVRSKTQGDPPPVVGASAQHMGSEPIEFGSVPMGVGLPFDFPASIGRIEVPKRPTGPRPSPGGFIGPTELGLLIGVRRVEKGTRLDHRDLKAGIGEYLGGHAPSGSRSHDYGIIDCCILFDLHILFQLVCSYSLTLGPNVRDSS